MKKVLAINSGSSSFKYKLFSLPDEKVLAKGMADRVGLEDSSFEIKLADGTKHVEKTEIPDQEAAVSLLIKFLKGYHVVEELTEIVGVGHRVVNGGEYFKDSTIITKENLPKIYELSDYAPLHNPAEARGIEAFMNVLPNVPEVAVFDTTYHRNLDPVHYLYSLPYEYYEKYGVRKYGAHGTSIRYTAPRAAKLLGKDLKDLIEQYKKSELDLLDFDAEKRKKVSEARQKLFYTIEHLQIMKDNKDSLYTIDKAIEDIKYAFDELEDAEHKYDYSKLPKKN